MKRSVEVFENNVSLSGLAEMHPPIAYSLAHKDCELYLVTPWKEKGTQGGQYPLIFFIQGSSWKHPNVWRELGQLAMYVQRGYTVASVVHRNTLDGFAFPTYLEDCKCALRYLRAHAAECNVDPARVCVWGTSSGGNTALLMGLTGDDAHFKTAEYANESDAAQLIIDCFGPTDIPGFIDIGNPLAMKNDLLRNLVGAGDPMTVGREMSPVNHVEVGKAYPPFMLIHGDADPVVPYDQSVKMAEKLDAAGADVTLIRVAGGVHEGNFWSDRLHARILRFIQENL